MARTPNLEGLDKVLRVFKNMSRESAAKVTDALNRGGKELADLAESIAPVGIAPHVKDTIKAHPPEITGNGTVVSVEITAGDAKTANAAHRSEFGRKPGGSGKVDMSGHPGHPAQPFMLPAFHAKRKRIEGRIARAIRLAAKKAALRR